MINPLLLTFVYAVETGSFTKTARKLYITPASVMKQMNTLEQKRDLKLLIRTHQGIQTTLQGERVYEETKKLIEHSNQFLNELKNQSIIRIGSSFLNPAKEFIELWHNMPSLYQNYKLRVVPYNDDQEQIMDIFQSLGTKFDFLIGAFNSKKIQSFTSYKELGKYRLCVALPKKHPLASKEKLKIDDLFNQKLLCVSSGDCLDIDDFRQDMLENYPQIQLEDVGHFYDLNTFNRCEEEGSLLLTLDAWKNIHPSLITLPVEWDYEMPYGLLYRKIHPHQVEECLQIIQQSFAKDEK